MGQEEKKIDGKMVLGKEGRKEKKKKKGTAEG
jgi:hypothetical protein